MGLATSNCILICYAVLQIAAISLSSVNPVLVQGYASFELVHQRESFTKRGVIVDFNAVHTVIFGNIVMPVALAYH